MYVFVCLIRYISELRLVRVLGSEGGIYKFSAGHEDASVDHSFHVYVNSKCHMCYVIRTHFAKGLNIWQLLTLRYLTLVFIAWSMFYTCMLNMSLLCLCKVSLLSSPRRGPLMDRCDALLQVTRSLKSAGTSVSCPTRGMPKIYDTSFVKRVFI